MVIKNKPEHQSCIPDRQYLGRDVLGGYLLKYIINLHVNVCKKLGKLHKFAYP